MLELSCSFYERRFRALKIMGKFTVTYGGFNVVRAKPQATRPKVRMGRSRELPHALNTNQI